MLLKLIRHSCGDDASRVVNNAIHGELYIDGILWTKVLERKGVEILPLWYTVSVTMSPRFKRLLPIVNNVPRAATPRSYGEGAGERSGIRFHTGTKPEHSAGCILVPSREIESRLTQTLLQAQQRHETIYLEIVEEKYPAPLYDVPCPAHERMRYLEAERIRQEYYRNHPDELPAA